MDFNRPVSSLHIEFTTTCNLRCPQCPRYVGDDINPNLIPNELTLDSIQELLPWHFLVDLKHIYSCGNFGDPAAAKDLLKMWEYIRDCAPDTLLGMHSNGSLRNPNWWRDLVSVLGKDHYVVFSIDGLEDTNHIYRRGAKWSKIMENAKAFIDAGGNAQWAMLVFDHNQHQVDQVRQLAKDMGFTKFTTKLTRRKVPNTVKWLKLVNDKPLEIKKTHVDCLALRNEEVYLGADGKFYPCCYVGGDIFMESSSYYKDFTDEDFKQMTYRPGLHVCETNCSTNDNNQGATEQQFQEITKF